MRPKLRVFILEDEIDGYRHPIVEALNGHDLTIAKSKDEGIAKYKGPYDLMLLDHDMNGQFCNNKHPNTGLQFIKWLVELDPQCARVRERIWCDECDYPKSEAQYIYEGAQNGVLHTPKPKVILHSQNPDGRLNMGSLLIQHGFKDVAAFPYSISYPKYLKKEFGL